MTPRASEMVARLEEPTIDWSGEPLSDAETPRVDVQCGLLREAATLIATQAEEIEHYEAFIKNEQEAAVYWCGEAAKLNERATAAESTIASLQSQVEAMRAGLEVAAEDFRTIKALNSHGASDHTYIGWLRNNAAGAEARARSTLAAVEKETA